MYFSVIFVSKKIENSEKLLNFQKLTTKKYIKTFFNYYKIDI